MKLLRLGSRGSALALNQSQWVASRLKEHHPNLEITIEIIKTRGDRDQNSALNKFAGKGIFTKEIEEALLAGSIDLAVHSLKDLPTQLPDGLSLAAIPRREDPRDLLVAGTSVDALPEGALVGTGSARRREQLRLIRPDLKFAEIRGNVATRVGKWRDGQYSATILACAGVSRLGEAEAGLKPGEATPLSLEQCVPAACQGLLGLEVRENDGPTRALLSYLSCPDAETAATAERAFLEELGGGCHLPAGALAEIPEQGQIQVTAFLMLRVGEPTQASQRVVLRGPFQQAAALGRQAARDLKDSLSLSESNR